MKRRWKKVLCFTTAAALALTAAGCGGGSSAKEEESTKSAGSQKETQDKPEGDEKIQLTIWSLYGTNPDDKSAVAFQETVKEIMEEDPSLEIQLDYAENEAYKTKIKAAVAANEAPDIYGTWGGGFTKPFVEADKVLQIDEYMTDDIKGQLLPGVLDYFTFEDKLYGLPTKMSTCHLFINKKIMEENNVEIPTTYAELLEGCKTLRENGVTPIALGAKDRWAIGKVFDMMGVLLTNLRRWQRQGHLRKTQWPSAMTRHLRILHWAKQPCFITVPGPAALSTGNPQP